MIFCSTKLIVFLLLMFQASLEKTSSNNKIILESELPKKVQVKRSYADLLNSLIKVNQERVTALKKLYVLNSITYGKDVLRSTIENKLDDYDKMQERLIRTLRQTLDNLKLAPKVSIDENELDEILQDRDHIFVLPIENNIDKEQLKLALKVSIDENDLNEILQDRDHIFVLPIENNINKEQVRNKVENVLRNKDSDDDSSNEKTNDKSDSDDKNDSESASSEKTNEESLNEVKGNGTQGRSYYYGCGRGRVRCIKACKEAYRETCAYFHCGRSFRKCLKTACKMECRMWFY
ncbi:ATP-dependent zinc metalloprotease FtsH isoform X3 [Maniola jurtina]|uniref:ATP-dependent zinc metalloprotease FtsH isoform X3 n=1 Tax=Maniola jurtina TaxID=191418 RepID=UPI001E68A3FA|nr:ATP-dependent zinc metalloprotease FtsH isoform X3 [Maniola jurtina]